MHSETIEYFDADQRFIGYFCHNSTILTPKPLVLVVHDWTGLKEHDRERAEALADVGYAAFAVDMYGDGKTGSNNDEKLELLSPLMEDRNLIIKRLQAALNVLESHAEIDFAKKACLGFCFGGTCALDAARAGLDLNAVISFHGNLSPANFPLVLPIQTSILALHGNDDPMVSTESVIEFQNELTAAKADWQFISYGNAMHSFTNKLANDPDFGTVYNAIADKRSWKSCLAFLEEAFSE